MALPIQYSGSTVRMSPLHSSCLAALPAQAQNESALLGGPKGVVKSAKGDLLEGIMVQLIAQKSAIAQPSTATPTDATNFQARAGPLHIADRSAA